MFYDLAFGFLGESLPMNVTSPLSAVFDFCEYIQSQGDNLLIIRQKVKPWGLESCLIYPVLNVQQLYYTTNGFKKQELFRLNRLY